MMNTREAFMDDQRTILNVLITVLSSDGIVAKPVGKSKYEQACEILYNQW